MPGQSIRPQQLKRPRWLATSLVILTAWIVFTEICANRLLVINTSSSVPPGIYCRSTLSPAVGRIIDFCVPAFAAAYVTERSGYDGHDWYILKPILAGPGDWIDTINDRLLVNGKDVAPISNVDSAGRPLPRWRASRELQKGEYFVYSGRIPNSFDSRYYGPIRSEQIQAVRVPLVTW